MKTNTKILALMPLLAGVVWLLSADRAPAQTFTNLYSFTASSYPDYTNSDGANPVAGLVSSGNVLFGVTTDGGRASSGTVFRVNTDGSDFTNLYSFTAAPYPEFTNSDGSWPVATLALSGNVLFGTTGAGGSGDSGSVFRVNTDGSSFTNLHSFSQTDATPGNTNWDGAQPHAGLILVGNVLYGTTTQGGNMNGGTVFRVNADGSDFTTLHSFAGPLSGVVNNGRTPLAGLVLAGSTLFGTTQSGGTNQGGTVFAINTNGSDFVILKSFSEYSDEGFWPTAALVISGNTLYGTTSASGGYLYKGGTVFQLNADGTGFTNLHAFTDIPGGGLDPNDGLLLAGHTLYGITRDGGLGYGAIFKVNTDGTSFTSLFTFKVPALFSGGLVKLGNTLFGTTQRGGDNDSGAVFSLTLKSDEAPQLAVIRSGPSLVLTWPAAATGFILQTNGDLATPSWSNCGGTITTNGDTESVTLPSPTGNLFFRLQSQ